MAHLEPLKWRFDPWKEQPKKTAAVFFINCAIMLVVYFSYQNDPAALTFVFLSGLFMFGMTFSLLVPIRYKFDAKGVTVYFLGVPSFKSWAHYRNMYVHKNGVFLTSMRRPSGLDPFRGHLLLYGAANRQEVVAYAKRHIKPQT